MFPWGGQGRQQLGHDLDGTAAGLPDPGIVFAQGAGLFVLEVTLWVALEFGSF